MITILDSVGGALVLVLVWWGMNKLTGWHPVEPLAAIFVANVLGYYWGRRRAME